MSIEIIRPELTEEERNRRLNAIKEDCIKLFVAEEKKKSARKDLPTKKRKKGL